MASASTPTRPKRHLGPADRRAPRGLVRAAPRVVARAFAAARDVRDAGERDGERREEQVRQRRHEREHDREDRGRAQHVGALQELRREVDAERAVAGHARDHQAHRRREQERRQRRDERVADREDRERVERVERTEPVVGDADDDAADEIEHDDDERRDRIAFDELARAVHRAVEIGFSLHARAFAARALGIEHARMHLGVDRHLFAGHRVERESRRDFGDALRARRDDDELNRDEDRENDQADDEIAAHDECAEGRE